MTIPSKRNRTSEEESGKELPLSVVQQESVSTVVGALVEPDGSPSKAENDKGIAQYQQERWDVAAHHFQNAVESDPDKAKVHYNLALALEKLGHHTEATEHFRKVLELAPNTSAIQDLAILKAHVKKRILGANMQYLPNFHRKVTIMTSDEAGRPEDMKSKESKSHCLHQRVIDYHYDEKGNRSGMFICRECQEIIPDPIKSLH